MAKMTFDQANSMQSQSNPNFVQFFTLKNDGEEAVVRIMHDDVSDFDILSVHPITIDGRYRSVSCVRTDPREPMSNCPLCASGTAVHNSIYIHILQYEKDESGNIVAVPKVWERSLSYATRIKNLIIEYGPLSQNLFKIRRNGKPGSRETSYDILYAHPNIYRPEIYPIADAFRDFSALGTCALDKSFDELQTFVTTGKFPDAQNNNVPNQPIPQTAQAFVPPTTNFAPPVQTVASAFTPVTPNTGVNVNAMPYGNAPQAMPYESDLPFNNGNMNTPSQPARQAPWVSNDNPTTMDRPVRYY